jgi:hypothetical protein
VTDAAKKLLDEVLALPEEDQRWLSDALLDRIDPITDDVREAWNRVAVERLERLERGEDDVVPWDEAEARISAALRGE